MFDFEASETSWSLLHQLAKKSCELRKQNTSELNIQQQESEVIQTQPCHVIEHKSPCLLENRIFEENEMFEERVELDDTFDNSLEVRWDDDNDSLLEESIHFDFSKSIPNEDLICPFQKDLSLENTMIKNLKDGRNSDSFKVGERLTSMLEESEYLKDLTLGDLENLDHVLWRSKQNNKYWGGFVIFSTFINPHRPTYKPPSSHDYSVLWLSYMIS
ncbi:hypothetical protein RND81_05G272600 [Saponaria officinalis]|uniref:Uncharacterized protein n=1 Tax=Saponaria officinalis TaxID=3572 RepID=A0AAW1KX91_SAPOF